VELHTDDFLKNTLSRDSTFQYNSTGDSSSAKYFYKGGNLPVKSNQYIYSKITGAVLVNIIIYGYDEKGNLVSAVGTDTNAETWEFYPDMLYILPDIQPYYRQITNNNLVKKHTVTSGGNIVETTVYTYTFDSNHRLSTETAITDVGDTTVKTYTYY
jgi:hypothetical protein